MQAAARGVAFSSSLTSSASSSGRVFIELSKVVRRSNIRWCGKSFAASVPSSSSKPRKGQKRIPKQERRAMVESFVDKYRASNAGQFPTASRVQQQIGGSYYIIRLIVQELEYNYKNSHLIKTDEVQLGKSGKVNHQSSDAKKVTSLSEAKFPTAKAESNVKVLNSINKDEDPLLEDVQTIPSEAAKHASLTCSIGDSTVEEPLTCVTAAVKPLSEQIVEGFTDHSIDHAQTNVVHGKDAHNILDKEILQDSDRGSTGGQESMASTSSAASSQQAVSETWKTTKTSHSALLKQWPLTCNGGDSSGEEPLNPVTAAIKPLSEQIAEGFTDHSISGSQTNIVHGKGARNTLAKEILQDSDRDSTGDQESMASTSSAASSQQADFSLYETWETTKTSHSSLGDIERRRKDTSTTEHLKDSDVPKGAAQIGNYKDSKLEELSSDERRKSEHAESTPQAANFWGNLKSFADGILNFWRKKM